MTVLQARVFSRVVSQVFLEDRSFWETPGFLLLLLGLLLGRAILSWSSDACASAMTARIKSNLRQRLFEHIFAQGPIGYRSDREERTGELVNVLTDGIEALDAYISQYLPQLVLGAFVPLTFLAFILPLDLLSGVILLLTAPLIPIFMILIGNLAEALTKRQWLALSRMSAYFLDVIQGLSTLKTLGRSQEQAQRIHAVSERYRWACAYCTDRVDSPSKKRFLF